MVVLDVHPLQWSHIPPNGRALVKFFTVDDNVDVADFVRKAGDTMTGQLTIDAGHKEDNQSNSFVITGNVESGDELLKDWRRSTNEGNQGRYDEVLYFGSNINSNSIINLGYLKDNYLPLTGGTLTGQTFFNERVDIKKPQRTDKPDNSFVLSGPIWNKEENKYEMKTLLKDYRPTTSSKYSASIWYYGLIDNPAAIINLGYLQDNYLPLAGGFMDGKLTIAFMAEDDEDRFVVGNGSYKTIWVPKGHEMHCRGRIFVDSLWENGGNRDDKNKLATIEEVRNTTGEDFLSKSGTQLLKTEDWNIKGPQGEKQWNYIHIKNGNLHLYHVPEATNDSWAAQWGQTKNYVHNPQKSVKVEADVAGGSNKVFDVRPKGYENGQSAFSVRGTGEVKAGKDSSNPFMATVDNDVVTKGYFDAHIQGSEGAVAKSGTNTNPSLKQGELYLCTTDNTLRVGL